MRKGEGLKGVKVHYVKCRIQCFWSLTNTRDQHKVKICWRLLLWFWALFIQTLATFPVRCKHPSELLHTDFQIQLWPIIFTIVVCSFPVTQTFQVQFSKMQHLRFKSFIYHMPVIMCSKLQGGMKNNVEVFIRSSQDKPHISRADRTLKLLYLTLHL